MERRPRGATPRAVAWRGSNESWSASGGRCFLLRLCRFLPALRCLGPELLREALDAAFRVDELLAAGKERMAIRANFEVQLVLGLAGLPRGSASATGFDLVILRVDAFFHNGLLRQTTSISSESGDWLIEPPGHLNGASALDQLHTTSGTLSQR